MSAFGEAIQAGIDRMHDLQEVAQRIATRNAGSADDVTRSIGEKYGDLARTSGARCDRLIAWRGVRTVRGLRGAPCTYVHAMERE